MSSSRKKRGLVAVAIAGLVGGLLTFAAPSAQSLDQVGTPAKPNNYYGPAPCPDVNTWNCEINGGDVEITVNQKAANGGVNRFVCGGVTCGHPGTGGVTQSGIAVGDKPTNEASCNNTANGEATSQYCVVHQHGGSNTINADFTASATRDESVTSTASIAQVAKQRFITTQDGDNNTLNIKGTINQHAGSTVALNLPIAVTHKQGTLQLADNDMLATSSNVASYVLNRTQDSSVQTGGFVTQLQDSPEVQAETEPGVGLGEIDLVANSGGTNTIKVHGADAKTQNTTGPQTKQTQGHDGGGWLATLKVDSTTDNEGEDIDIGAPGSDAGTQNPGLKKVWFQHAAIAPDALADQTQNDGIKIPIISQSPFDVRSNSFCNLESDTGARIVASQTADGRAKDDWTGRLACNLKAGAKIQNPIVNFAGRSIHADLRCELNADVCPGGEFAAPNAQLAVRNVGTEEGFTNAASAGSGDTVQYQGTFTNTGNAPAEDVLLTAPIPSNTTLVAATCAAPDCSSDGGSVTWNLGTVGGGADPVVRTFDVTVNPGTPSGSFTGKSTGSFGPEEARGTFESNETTLTFVAPESHAHLAVRNVSSSEAFTGDVSHPTGPISTEAQPGQTVEYAATFHNEGDGAAKNATLSASTPAGITCVSGCPEGGSWSLGDVPAGASTRRTFQAQVGADTPTGPIPNTTTGDDDQEDPFDSNEAVVTIVEVPARVIQIDVLESTINTTKPKNGVATVVINDPTVVPKSVCFGDLEEGQCTGGTSLGVGNFDGDPQQELKMKFLIKDTGIDPGDDEACLTGETPSREAVTGCDAIRAI